MALNAIPTDAPIPGQSLTDSPQNARWENPPQFVDLDEAAEHVWSQLQGRNSQIMLLAMLDKGIPVEMIADVVIFTGFSEGKWTPDISLMLKQPVMHMLAAIGAKEGVGGSTPIFYKDRSVTEDLINLEKIDLSKMHKAMSPQENMNMKRENAPPAPIAGAGFMAPPMGGMNGLSS